MSAGVKEITGSVVGYEEEGVEGAIAENGGCCSADE